MLGLKDIDVRYFVYYRRPTVASTLWAIWRLAPKFLRLKVYQCLIYFGHRSPSPRVKRLPFGLYAKHGKDTSVAEALVTQYVSVNTTIPVPDILDVLLDSVGAPLILMTRVPGRQLAEMPGSANDLSDAQRHVFIDTITNWLAQLRQLGPPPSGPAVCGFMGTPFMSYRINHSQCVGPYSSLDEFHRSFYCALPSIADPDMLALEKRIREKPCRICFTHGDISPNNLLVNEEYVPVGLVDWGCAAWMPEWWELTSCIYRRQPYLGWVHVFKAALPQYEDELAVEMEMWNFISPW